MIIDKFPLIHTSAFKLIIIGSIFALYATTTKAQDDVISVLDATIDSLDRNIDYTPVDSAYLQEIEQLLINKQKEQEAKEAIELSERKLLATEMSFDTEGIMPILRGSIMKFTENGFNKRPGVFHRHNKDNFDYGVAGAPLVASWIMKASGVESRSSTRRMLLSNAMALAISCSFIKGLKLSVNSPRPDNDGEDSFPSGHSSFAFVGATILHREFGHHSPWISVGGYATATATQMLRLKHNRHWVHETFVGAGIGMVSTNLAYFITDKIFGEKDINSPRLTYSDMTRVLKYNTQPSSFSFVSGTEVGNRTISNEHIESPSNFSGNAKIHVGAGFTAGVEGSWFVNPNVAFDAIVKLTTSKAKISMSGTPWHLQPMYASNLDFYRFALGVKYSYPIAMAHRFSLRLFAGTRTNNEVCFEGVNDNSLRFHLPEETKFDSGISITYDCITSKKYSYGFNFDYHHTDSKILPHRYGVSTVWKILL